MYHAFLFKCQAFISFKNDWNQVLQETNNYDDTLLWL